MSTPPRKDGKDSMSVRSADEQAERDAAFMGLALKVAEEAGAKGEVPVGAVVVVGDEVIATAGNTREESKDPTGHAELLAIRKAAEKLSRWRLFDADIYVTLEPCPMCAGAMVNARVRRLVYGCSDPKAGAVKSLFSIVDDPRLNHRVEVVEGVREAEAAQLLKSFFAGLRARNAKRHKAAVKDGLKDGRPKDGSPKDV